MHFMGRRQIPRSSLELTGLENSRFFIPWVSSSLGMVHDIEIIVAFLSKAT